MGTNSARPDDLKTFASRSRGADDELDGYRGQLLSLYHGFVGRNRWGHFDAESMLQGFGRYLEWNEIDARWVREIAIAFQHAGGDGALKFLPDAAIKASLRAAGLDFDRQHVTFDDPVAYGFPPTTGYADDPVNTASGNFVALETDLAFGGLAQQLSFGRVYNSRSDAPGAFGRGWSSWADVRLHAVPDGVRYAGPDGQRVTFPRMGSGYGRVVGVSAMVEPLDDGLALRWFDGRRWEFDDAGRPRLVTDGPGSEIRLVHEGDHLLTLARAGGSRVHLDWDAERVVAARSSDGRAVAYEYESDGNLRLAHAPDGTRSYGLASDGRVRSVTDADGVVEVRNVYDAEGRVLKQRSPFGRHTIYGYLPGHVTVIADEQGGPPNTYIHDQAGRLLAIVDGDEQQMSLNYDAWGHPVAITQRNGAVTVQEWDEESRLVRRVLPGGAVFGMSYDAKGRVLEVAAGSGETTAYVYEGDERSPVEIIDPEGGLTRLTVRDGLVREIVDPDGVAVAFEFDADGNVVAVVDADGNEARMERDAAGRVVVAQTPMGRRTTYRYDAQGRLAELQDPGGGVWRYEHTAAGRLAAVTDPAGAREELRYGEHGRLAETVDALGHATSQGYDIFGNLTRLVAADGATWQIAHDALARPLTTTDPLGAIWRREYDVEGNQVASIDPAGRRYGATYDLAGRITALTDGLTSSAFEFDALGRTLGHRRPDGSEVCAAYDRCGRAVSISDATGATTRIEYSPAGRVRRVIAPSGAAETYEHDACGRCVARTDGENRRHRLRYDADGATVEQIDPSGASERLVYDEAGRVVERAAPGEGITTYAYDVAGRIVEITDRVVGTRRFAYDAAGRLVGAIDANANATRYAYDERDRLIEIVDPLGGTTVRTYDAVGRMTSETDPLGRTTSLTYDAAGRLSEELDGSGRRTIWTYDVSGRVSSYGPAGEDPIVIARDELGREATIREPGSFTHELRWDREGRLVERRRDDLALSWSYDADGRRTSFGLPDGTRTTYRHDAGGYLVGLEHTTLGAIALERDPAGRLTAAIGAGMQARWDYDGGDLVAYELDAGGRRRSTQLSRDAVGRVVSGLIDGERHHFAYDAAGQLVSAQTPAGRFEFDYDGGGRLVREAAPAGTTRYDHDAGGQLLQRRPDGGPATGYEYDGGGRRVRETREGMQRRYRWDALGRLSAIEDGERTTAVRVDALGELAEVDATRLMWDTADPMSPLASIGEQAVVGHGSPWATATAGGATQWLAPDWQGTIGSGRDPWGTPAASLGPQLGYRGEVEFDGDVWLRNRVYQPATRSFLQRDPLDGLPGGPGAANPYHYAAGNPLGAADPLGLHPVSDAELQRYRDQMNRSIWDKGADFLEHNWEYVAAGALVVAGGALMITGVGGPAGIALMSAGISVGLQKATTGHVDPLSLGIDTALGVATLGLGGVMGPVAGRVLGPALARAGELGSSLAPKGLVARLFGEKVALAPYAEGLGHHIPAKSAFRGAAGYADDTALAIPKAELERLGIRHADITGAQSTLYRQLAKAGEPLTWNSAAAVERQALIKAGMNEHTARLTVDRAISALRAAGVKEPTRIPWGS